MASNLERALANINKKYGENSILRLGDASKATDNILSTGSLLIDKILGGGIPKSRIVEVYGAESSGKTSLALQCVAQAQKRGDLVAIIDCEQAMNPVYASQLGVDIDNLYFSQPSCGEEAFDICEDLVKTGEFKFIVIDSIAAMTPTAILQGEVGDVTVGALSRLVSKGLSRLIPLLNSYGCTLICINQTRTKINTGFSMGDPTTTTGGAALKFYASQRIELKKTTAIKEGDEVIGYNTKITIKKNKIGAPMKTCTIPFMFGKGFGGDDEVITLGLEYGFIEQSGAWFKAHNGERFQGAKSMRAYYYSERDVFDNLKKRVVAKLQGVEFDTEIVVNEETGEIIE